MTLVDDVCRDVVSQGQRKDVNYFDSTLCS